MMLLMAVLGGGSAPRTDLRPIVDDPIVMQMRPAPKPLATLVIAQDGSGDFATFSEAIFVGLAIQAAALAEKGMRLDQITPNFRIDCLCKPGDYDVTGMPGFGFFGFYATGPKGSTTIRPGIEFGAAYWEGIDIINDQETGWDPKYAMHLHAGRMATIITRCTLSNPSSVAGGGYTPVGMDGMPDASLIMHDVDFTTGTYLNNHGPIEVTPGSPGMSIVYSECRFPGGSLYFNTLNDSDPTEMWVSGGSAETVGLRGESATLHLDPATAIDRFLGSYAGHVKLDGSLASGGIDSRTDWPVPVGGMSAQDRAYYGM